MRRSIGVGFVVLVLLALAFSSVSHSAHAPAAAGDVLHLPEVANFVEPPTPTSAPTATATPTATPQPAPTTPAPTPTSPGLPPSYNNCQADPYAGSAPNTPVAIVSIDKVAETVTIRNVSGAVVNVAGWRICSITGNQQHATLSGTLAPSETRVVPSQAGTNIWNNSSRDDGALYNAAGQLVSYHSDH